MRRRHLLFAAGCLLAGSGCSGREDGVAATRSPAPSVTRSPSPTASPDRPGAGHDCPAVPDLRISNLTPRTLTVTITVTAMGGRYRGESPTPTRGRTPVTDTPVRTLRETFELGPVDHQDADGEHRRAYDSVPRRTGWHRLAVDIEDGPERAFPFHPPYGKQEGFAVSIQAEDGITGGVGGVSCG